MKTLLPRAVLQDAGMLMDDLKKLANDIVCANHEAEIQAARRVEGHGKYGNRHRGS
jgi:hypothetical protein